MDKKNEAFDRYDTADYLLGVEDTAAYLEAALEEAGDDPAFIAQTLGTIARSGNVSELARRTGMSREGLYKALSADGNPSFATILKGRFREVRGLWGGGVELKPAEVEVDRGLEVLSVSVAAGGDSDRLDA